MSSATAATTTACAGLYNSPAHDASCAIPAGGNHTEIMSACCNGADVVSYYDDCGLYCLAEGQTVQDLILCLYNKGAGWSDVFCSGSSNGTATGTTALPTGAGASVVVGTATSTTKTGTKTGTTTGTVSSSSSTSSSAASSTRPQAIVSTLGIAVGTLLFSVAAVAVQQV
ncbi:hypothetical protein CMQ_6817 [Grosmannia clavigera kw1407]|uniref:Uncharacterized protein n=1 Tax=Grosmannia clavigera (strain kw1407 / UAMH 11150) TaxID=655863 RepID=F0X793_GROCL|nr:uncharacterized protein CMQ_6817 [Grosmannia clavigera kw1407]EFX06496.1 hypothetical protein CMQ_6817 [Grosmannia clavigera kw1407]